MPTVIILTSGSTWTVPSDWNATGATIEAIGALLNSGTIKIYCGTQPTNPDTALSGNTLAATFTFNSTAFGSASLSSSKMQITGSLSASTVTAAATCTATFARFLESDGTTVVADMDVGTSGTPVILNSTSITSGGNVTISSVHLNMPVDCSRTYFSQPRSGA